MERKLIVGPVNDNMLNNQNHNFKVLFEAPERIKGLADEAVERSNTAINISEESKLQSQQAEDKADSVQSQFNQVVIEGDSSVEAAAARVGADGETHATLKERLDSENTNVNQQLADTVAQARYANNAKLPIPIPTYDGSGQTVHPDGLYFKSRWNGYRYWMVHTPYPDTNDVYENPSIVASQDGITWVTPTGLINPLDQPTPAELLQNVHLSDGVIFMVGNTMEMWYRYRNKNTNEEYFLRRTSTNGVTWTPKEVVYKFTVDTARTWGVSPTLIYENGKYRMWLVSGDGIWRTESTTGKTGTWSDLAWVQVNWKGEAMLPWHIDVTKKDGRYNLIINTQPKTTNDRYLAWASSADGNSFGGAEVIMSPAIDRAGWDNKSLYRASLVYVDDKYRLYYSAMNINDQWKVGAVEGTSIDSMVGILPVNQEGTLLIDKVLLNDLTLGRNILELKNKSAYFKNDELQFHEPGFASVKLKMTGPNTVELQSESGALLGILKLSTVMAPRIQTSRLDSADGLMSLLGNLKIVSDPNSGVDGFLSVTHTGRGSVGLKPETNNVTQLTDERGVRGNTLGVAGIWFNADRVASSVEGMIRYDPITKKHQGHDGTRWWPLY